MIPTRRTFMKFGRDLAVAIAVAVGVFVTDHAIDLGLSPEVTAIVVAIVLGLLRTARGWAGREPPG